MPTNSKPLVKPRVQGLTSKQLAKSKGVSATKQKEDGQYTLVAVIEGREANAKLTGALNTISTQRGELSNLKKQFNLLPVSAQQQRELLAGEINQRERLFEQNVRYMQAHYGYTLQNQYLLVPEHAVLALKGDVDGEEEVVKEFASFAQYEEFQTLRANYQVRLNALVQEWGTSQVADENGEKRIEAQELAALKADDTELQRIDGELKSQFTFDLSENYTLHFEKSALYVKTS